MFEFAADFQLARDLIDLPRLAAVGKLIGFRFRGKGDVRQ